MEGFMNAMFTPPDHLYHENSIVEQPLSTKQLDEHPLDEHPLDEHHLDEQQLDEQQLDEQQRVKPPPSPRSVCRMWKNKRRQQRQRAMELKLMDTNISSDGSLQSELKQSALKVQKVYEDSPEDDDDAYRYEKYGSRAEFAQSRKPHRIRIVV
jgi:hypothetical protein